MVQTQLWIKPVTETQPDLGLELWKPIPGFSRYEASTHGRVRNRLTDKFVTISTQPTGYTAVALRCGPTVKTAYVHRVIASTFLIPSSPDQIIVNHKDGIKTNNHLSNLEWVTQSQNIKHSWTLRRQSPN